MNFRTLELTDDNGSRIWRIIVSEDNNKLEIQYWDESDNEWKVKSEVIK